MQNVEAQFLINMHVSFLFLFTDDCGDEVYETPEKNIVHNPKWGTKSVQFKLQLGFAKFSMAD